MKTAAREPRRSKVRVTSWVLVRSVGSNYLVDFVEKLLEVICACLFSNTPQGTRLQFVVEWDDYRSLLASVGIDISEFDVVAALVNPAEVPVAERLDDIRPKYVPRDTTGGILILGIKKTRSGAYACINGVRGVTAMALWSLPRRPLPPEPTDLLAQVPQPSSQAPQTLFFLGSQSPTSRL